MTPSWSYIWQAARRPTNFGRLVLFYFEADFCVQIRILQHFSSSTRLSHFCTASISKFHQKICTKFRRMKNEISFSEWKMKLFRPAFDENLSEFRENFAENARIRCEIQTVCKKSGIGKFRIWWIFSFFISVPISLLNIEFEFECLSLEIKNQEIHTQRSPSEPSRQAGSEATVASGQRALATARVQAAH